MTNIDEQFGIIFLDFDGVLNDTELFKKQDWPFVSEEDCIYPHLVVKINKIVEVTGARIVLSTAWRHNRSFEHLRKLLVKQGLEAIIIDRTFSEKHPHHKDDKWLIGANRGMQCLDWLQKNKFLNIASFVMIDDNDLGCLHHRAVYTDPNYGITDVNVEEAIEILNTPIEPYELT